MRLRLFAALAVLALLVAGCSRPTRAVAPPPDVAPEADSPQNVVRRLQWALEHRDLRVIDELLTADFILLTAGTDSEGGGAVADTSRREDLLAMFEELFFGTPQRPPAVRVTLGVDGALRPQRDPRTGFVDSLFKTIRTPIDMTIEWQDGETQETTGYALFYLARGDTVIIPDHLEAVGFERDPRRWWMTRWEDETIALADPMRGARPIASPPVRMPGEIVPE